MTVLTGQDCENNLTLEEFGLLTWSEWGFLSFLVSELLYSKESHLLSDRYQVHALQPSVLGFRSQVRGTRAPADDLQLMESQILL